MCLLAVRAAGGGMSADVNLNCVCSEGVQQTLGMKFVKFEVISLIAPSLAGKPAMSMSSMVCSKLFFEMLITFFILRQVSGHFSNQ